MQTKLVPLALLLASTAWAQQVQVAGQSARPVQDHPRANSSTAAKSAIFFVGDGMGVSTVTAARIFSVGVDGQLVVDGLPYTALSRTYTSDHITPDSAGTMSAMMSGQNTNSGVIGLAETTERNDFNNDGDGPALTTLLEMAKASGKSVGVVSTARVTHATPAACYAHVNERNKENEIALQGLPGDPTYNAALGSGIDVLMGGGRRFYVPSTMFDEEGDSGSRPDGRDLRVEFQAAGYTYVWRDREFDDLRAADLPVLGLFESSHMEYEYDRITDVGGEPSITEMTLKAVELLSSNPNGFFLMVESGRIDHAHHAGNAWRCLVDTEEFDRSIGAAIQAVNLRETIVVVTADHSHVFNIAGYPLRPWYDLPYSPTSVPQSWLKSSHGGILNIAFDISSSSGAVAEAQDSGGVPYTTLVYGNGPGYRGGNGRVDPRNDTTPGLNGAVPNGPQDPEYMQEAAVPMGSETHSGEEVAIYAIGAGSSSLQGTVKNTTTFDLIRAALGL